MFAHTNLPGYKWTNCLSQVGLPISLSLAGAIGICTSLCQLLKLKTYSLRNCGASTFHHGKCKLKLATQSSLTLCDPMDCSPPGSSVHGILQARILEWVAISFSRGSSQPRDLHNPGIKPRSPTLWKTIYRLSHQGSLGETFYHEENGKPEAGKERQSWGHPSAWVHSDIHCDSAALRVCSSSFYSLWFHSWHFCSSLSHKFPGGESAKAWLVITQHIVTTMYS